MRHLDRLGSQFSISLPPDEEGLVGRECPLEQCEGYFKIQFGTGLKGKDLPCHCPYCGHEAGQNKFFTKAQVEYAKSVVLNKVTDALLRDLKTLEFNHPPRGNFGIGISMKVTGRPRPIHYYREEKLETEVVCDQCTLRYTIYGVFGFCPDCGVHNSLQILNKNLDLVEKLLAVAKMQDTAIAQNLIENALEDCVSAFDGFGRETCRVFSSKAAKREKAVEIRFQNISNARERVRELFAVDFASNLTTDDWMKVQRAFQKRHLFSHKMGVVDEDYLSATGETRSLLGRKISIQGAEIAELVVHLRMLGKELFLTLDAKKMTSTSKL
jgi:hypothetical protein